MSDQQSEHFVLQGRADGNIVTSEDHQLEEQPRYVGREAVSTQYYDRRV